MASDIRKPTAPIINIPIALTFEIVLNSTPVGFFNTYQTLLDCNTNDFNLLPNFIVS